jgi:hypothetical protein
MGTHHWFHQRLSFLDSVVDEPRRLTSCDLLVARHASRHRMGVLCGVPVGFIPYIPNDDRVSVPYPQLQTWNVVLSPKLNSGLFAGHGCPDNYHEQLRYQEHGD